VNPLFRIPLLLWMLCLTLTTSCGATLWNRPADVVKKELAAGDPRFVLSLTAKDLRADVGALGDGALWSLGEILAEAGRRDDAEPLWTRALAAGGVWGAQAGRDLFALYADRRDWVQAEKTARTLVDHDKGPAFQRLLFEAYYFQKKDDLAWPLLQSWAPGTFSPAEERENQLFRGVVAARLGKTGAAAEALTALVWNQDASELHDRLMSFLREDPTRAALLGPDGNDALTFQALVYRGVAADTDQWLRGRTLGPEFWNHQSLIVSLETAFKPAGRAERGLQFLETISPGLTGGARFEAAFAKGRLYRSLGRWPLARSAFQAALPLAATPDDHRKTAWNWLNAWVQSDPGGALGPFLQVYSSTAEPAYFSDVLSDWLSNLVQARRWDLLAAALRDAGRRMTRDDRATLGFVLAQLESYGLVDLRRQGIDASANDLLEQAIAADPFSYESLVARAILNRELAWPTQPAAEFHAAEDWDRTKTFWNGLADFGLGKRLTSEVAAYTGPLEPAFIDGLAARLQDQGLYRPSIQLLYRLLREPGQTLTKERAERLFPIPFEDVVSGRARDQGLEVSLLYGLIRAESLFDPGARSWVGARGLTQLMPATAAETALKLRMKTYDLDSVDDNVALGARYLSDMIRSQDRISLALMAYNAGGGRIKPWKTAMGRLPEEIFVEAAPLEETREYVKTILIGAVMTGVLHYGKTVGGMVRLIYPSF